MIQQRNQYLNTQPPPPPTTTTTTRTSSVHSLDPSNALSKLLDSAIAHAARESTPEVNEFEFDQQN